jgi:hypothetical protein
MRKESLKMETCNEATASAGEQLIFSLFLHRIAADLINFCFAEEEAAISTPNML